MNTNSNEDKMLKFKEFQNWLNEAGATVPVEIGKEIVGHIKMDDSEAKDKITKIAGSSASKSSVIAFLTDIGYPLQQANFLFDTLMHGSDMNILANYFANRTNKLDSFLGKVTDSYVINSTLGIDKKTSLEFFNFSWRTSPPMGPGEVYLSTILDGGKRPGTKDKGDVVVSGSELEVKGSGARLVGQHGYGDAKSMRKSFESTMERIAKSFKLKNFTVTSGDDKYWNITKKDARGLEENLKAIASQTGGFKPRDIVYVSSELVNAWSTYLINLDVATNSGAFVKCINKDGSIDVKGYNRALLQIFFDYYYAIEKFDYFSMTSSSGIFLIINPNDFMSYYDKNVIKITAPPSFSNAAGTQGGAFAISL
jgi:hypothetical protein